VRKLQCPALELPAQYPERLRELVRRATDPDPKARPSMREVRESLESLVERRGAAAESGRLVASAPAVMMADDVTTRVPDPTTPRDAAAHAEATTGPRTRGRRRHDRLLSPLVAAVATAAVILMSLALASMAHRPASAPASPAPLSPAPPVSAKPRRATTPAPSAPVSPVSARPSPSASPALAAPSASYRDPLALPIPGAAASP